MTGVAVLRTVEGVDLVGSLDEGFGVGPGVTSETPRLILFTNGTIGDLKGAVISHRRSMIDASLVIGVLDVRPYQRYLCFTPLFHTGACDSSLRCDGQRAQCDPHGQVTCMGGLSEQCVDPRLAGISSGRAIVAVFLRWFRRAMIVSVLKSAKSDFVGLNFWLSRK